MKLKHNKKRNTAFLYEVLVRHLTNSILEQSEEKRVKVSRIIKEHFRKGSLLREELEIYKVVLSEEKHGFHVAEKLIYEAKKAFINLKKDDLFIEQTAAIKSINASLGRDAYSVFIPNYKSLATIQQIFNVKTPIKTRVLLEAQVIHNLCYKDKKENKEMVSVSNLTYKTFVRKFNKQYGAVLLPEQKTLLGKYINSFSDNGMGLNLYLSEEVTRLKGLVKNLLKKEEVLLSEQLTDKMKKLVETIDRFKKEEVSREMVEKVLKIQSLVKEI